MEHAWHGDSPKLKTLSLVLVVNVDTLIVFRLKKGNPSWLSETSVWSC